MRWVAAFVVVCVAGAACGRDYTPADAKLIQSYVLTMEKVRALADAEAEARQDPTAWSHRPAETDSLSTIEIELQGNADTMKIFARHGLSAADVVLIPVVLDFAGQAARDPKAAAKNNLPVSPEQIAFAKAHQAELQAINWSSY
jgi:hypothetical protein